MERARKEEVVQEIRERFESAENCILFDFRGMKVVDVVEFRHRVKETNSRYRVVKNTLAKLAVEGTHAESLKDHFQGTVGVAFNQGDPVALAKAVKDFSKKVPVLKFRVALIEGRIIQEEEFKVLANLPGKDQLLSQLVFVLAAPVTGLARALNGCIRNLAVVLDQVRTNRESEG